MSSESEVEKKEKEVNEVEDTDHSEPEKKKAKKRSRSPSTDSSSDSDKKKKKKKDKKKKHKSKKDKKDKNKKDKNKKDRKDRKDRKDKKRKKDSEQPPVETVKIPEREKVGLVEAVASSKFGLVEKKILKVGYGRKPERGQTVTVSGTAYIEAGMRQFWSTTDKYAKPYSFAVGIGRVIPGWDTGVMAMRLGEKARLTITGAFGYGMKGNPELKIPPMANLIFDLELQAIGNDFHMPTPEEIAKQKIANRTVFVERDAEDISGVLSFNAAPF